jgi:hypothetical protein
LRVLLLQTVCYDEPGTLTSRHRRSIGCWGAPSAVWVGGKSVQRGRTNRPDAARIPRRQQPHTTCLSPAFGSAPAGQPAHWGAAAAGAHCFADRSLRSTSFRAGPAPSISRPIASRHPARPASATFVMRSARR